MKRSFEFFILGAALYILARINLKTDYDDLIRDISVKHGNNPALVKAIIRKESGFNPNAHATKGEDSRGLGQINAATARVLGVTDLNKLYDPAYNVEILNSVLDDLKTRHTSIFDLIAAYNAGKPKFDAAGNYINSLYVADVFSWFLGYSVLT